ncbi:MAG: flagellar protein FlaG [Burkholderiales bacterium]
MDTQNHQVIRQIPSKEALAISQALDKLQGLIIRNQA